MGSGVVDGLHRFLRAIVDIVGGDDGQARFGQQLLAGFHVGAFQAHDHRHFDADFFHRGGDAFGDPDCFRMSYATSDENIVEAIRRIKEALSKLK